MLTKKLACPSCNVSLKVADSIAPGKTIKCPKCSTPFRVPAPERELDDDSDDYDRPRRPKRKKFHGKRRETSSSTPWIVGSVIGAVVVIGVVLTIVLWPKKTDQAASAKEAPKQAASGGADQDSGQHAASINQGPPSNPNANPVPEQRQNDPPPSGNQGAQNSGQNA